MSFLSENHVGWAEAWVRKKPKRIIQNQLLIELLLAVLPISAFVGVTLMWYAVWVFPLIAMLVLSVDVVGCAIYVGFFMYRRFYVK